MLKNEKMPETAMDNKTEKAMFFSAKLKNQPKKWPKLKTRKPTPPPLSEVN